MCLVVKKSVHRLAETLSFLIWEKAVARRLKRWTFVALLAAAAYASPPEPSANDALTAAQSSAPAAPVVAAIPADRLTPAAVAAADDFLWLEEVSGTRAMRWVNDQNKKTEAGFKADPRYDAFRVEALSILTAQDRIPAPSFRGEGIDNFWQDGKNVRGLWRATTLDSYTSDKPKWTTVLDIDALAKREGANWIYKGTECLAPDETVCLVNLSDGGKDAVRVREFDTKKKAFVAKGFDIPEGKHRIAWLDADTLLVATDFGAGSLTESGYPFIVKSLKRGQNLSEATEVYRGSAKDGGYGVDPMVMRDSAGGRAGDAGVAAAGYVSRRGVGHHGRQAGEAQPAGAGEHSRNAWQDRRGAAAPGVHDRRELVDQRPAVRAGYADGCRLAHAAAAAAGRGIGADQWRPVGDRADGAAVGRRGEGVR